MVARQATERLTDLRYTLRSFGVPLDGPAWLFGDNKSVVTSSTIPHSTLNKCWNALSYHRVHEAIAGGWLHFEHIPGTENPADILTKPLPWFMLKVFVEPLLLWKGDTADVPSGSSDPEGSDANPGREQSRESVQGVTSSDTTVRASNANRGADVRAGRPLLWNNQYAVLADDSPE